MEQPLRNQILVVEHHPGRGARIESLLRHFGFPVLLQRPYAGECPALGDFTAGVVLSGGPQSVRRMDAPEARGLRASEALLDAATDQGIPVLGICLGHQLMAQWAGGRVERMSLGVTGFQNVSISDRDAVLGACGVGFEVFEYHEDAVVRIPSGFELAGTSTSCAVEAIRCADLGFFGVQFHPEITREDGAAILAGQAPGASPWLKDRDVAGPLLLESFARYCTTHGRGMRS